MTILSVVVREWLDAVFFGSWGEVFVVALSTLFFAPGALLSAVFLYSRLRLLGPISPWGLWAVAIELSRPPGNLRAPALLLLLVRGAPAFVSGLWCF